MAGRTALVTGASSGIGKATAILLSQLGARVILSARNVQNLEQTCSELAGDGHLVEPVDFQVVDGVSAWLEDLARRVGTIDLLAHCAGVQINRPLRSQAEPQVESMLRLNLVSALSLAKGFRRPSVHGANAAMVLVSSIIALVGAAGRSAYAASKGGLVALTKSLAAELARDHIRVNCVAPGFVDTPMLEELRRDVGEAGVRAIETAHPLGFGRPADVAHAIAFLLADCSRWTTGSILVVDGGYTAL